MTLHDITPLLPGQAAPDLTVDLAGGGRWRLHDQTPRNLMLIVVYRGHHCGACREALEQWNGRAAELEALGVQALFVSADSKDDAERSWAEWDIHDLAVGYGWDLAQARRWGLYISHAIRETEPDSFLEPGFFVLDADFKLHSHSVQSMPNARPGVADTIAALRFIVEKDYPPRGAVPFVEADLGLHPDETAGG